MTSPLLDRLPVRRISGTIIVSGTRSVINARGAAELHICKGETLGAGISAGDRYIFPVIKEDA